MEMRVTRWMLVLVVCIVVIRVAGASGTEPLVVAPITMPANFWKPISKA